MVDKKPVLQIQLQDKWKSKKWKNKTILIPPEEYPHIQLWYVPEVKDVDAAVTDIANLVKSEVTEFKLKENKDIKIAGNPGQHLIGTGLEADDMDPSNAEVFVFSLENKVFILIVHGEGDEAAKHRKVVQEILTTAESVSVK